jgi:hypothetical protein
VAHYGQFAFGATLGSAQLNAIGTWTDYTPTLTNVSLGNGTRSGRWTRQGDLVTFWARIAAGTTTSISGLIGFSLPVTAAAGVYEAQFSGVLIDATGPTRITGFVDAVSTTQVDLYALSASGTYASAVATSGTVPFTVANLDEYIVAGTYEAA